MKNTTTNPLYVFEYSFHNFEIGESVSHYQVAKENRKDRTDGLEFGIGERESSSYGADYGQYTLHAIVETIEDARAVIANITGDADIKCVREFESCDDDLLEVWQLDTVRVLDRDETYSEMYHEMRCLIYSNTTDDELESFASDFESNHLFDIPDRMQLTDLLEIVTEYRDELIAEEIDDERAATVYRWMPSKSNKVKDLFNA